MALAGGSPGLLVEVDVDTFFIVVFSSYDSMDLGCVQWNSALCGGTD